MIQKSGLTGCRTCQALLEVPGTLCKEGICSKIFTNQYRANAPLPEGATSQ
jgi:hypothetical protein